MRNHNSNYNFPEYYTAEYTELPPGELCPGFYQEFNPNFTNAVNGNNYAEIDLRQRLQAK